LESFTKARDKITAKMASSDSPNPLRPYYVPPSAGFYDPVPPQNSTLNSNRAFTSSRNGTVKTSVGSSARNIFTDIDYSDYLSDDSPSVTELIRSFLDDIFQKYSTILLAQPFEVAKVILQCQITESGEAAGARETERGRREYAEDYYEGVRTLSRNSDVEGKANEIQAEEDSENDEPNYFTSNPRADPYASQRRHQRERTFSDSSNPSITSSGRSRKASDRSTTLNSKTSSQLVLVRRGAVLEVLGQVWQKEGAWGVWKGTNATFVYSILMGTVQSWTGSVLSAIISIPDPGLGGDIGDSVYPLATLGVSVAAGAIAALLLAPIDMIRTRYVSSFPSRIDT
jgi:mitochondrial fusion and transport protein UGO1